MTVDNEAKDAVSASEVLEEADVLVDPGGGCGVGRADDDQVAEIGEMFPNLHSQIVGRWELGAVETDWVESGRDLVRVRESIRPAGNFVGFECAMEPLGPLAVLVRVGNERPVCRCHFR